MHVEIMTTEEKSNTVLDQMRDCWDSGRCVCGNLKRARQDWFCKGCYWSLPKDIKNALVHRPYRAIAEWLRAVAMLKKDGEQ
jgi:hypothetical protein